MRKISVVTLILFLLLLFLFLSITVLLLSTNNTLVQPITKLLNINSATQNVSTPVNNTAKRGYLETSSDSVLYQFPALLLENPVKDDLGYSVTISAFDDQDQTYTMRLSPESISLPFGTCSYENDGIIDGSVTFTLTQVPALAERLQKGDEILIRLVYPLDTTGEVIQYAEEKAIQIDAIQNKTYARPIYPNALCVKNS